MEDIVIIGFGGHAKSVADCILRSGKYNIAGYTDLHDNLCRFQYLGTDECLRNIFYNGVTNAVLGIGFMGNVFIRDSVVRLAKDIGYRFPVIFDPSSVISEDAEIGEGTFVGKCTVINANSKIGRFCILNTGSVIEHDDKIGDYTHISVGAALCGSVNIGHHTLIGAKATVIQGKSIGDNSIVGANSTVLKDVGDNMKVYGIVR